MFICQLCPRKCRVSRSDSDLPGQASGFCRMGSLPVIARAALHPWEEPPICTGNGSGAVFFSGCTLRCKFCQNALISQEYFGKAVSVLQLEGVFKDLIRQGACNLNLVSPTPFVYAIRDALSFGPDIPVVFNSGGYELPETLDLMKDIVNVYLPDFKYADDHLAEVLSSAPNYREVALSAIDAMLEQVGPPVFAEGRLVQGVMIRHLVLPGHLENTFDCLDILSERYGSKVLMSLMTQYTPYYKAADMLDLSRPLTADEAQDAVRYLSYCEFADAYYQTRDSAGEMYIPPFEKLEGVPG